MSSGLRVQGFLVLMGFVIHSIMPCVKEHSLFHLFNTYPTASSKDVCKILLVRGKKNRKEHSETNTVHGLKES